MAMKFYLDTILLLYIYGFEGYLSRYKIDEMVNNLRITVNSSDSKKICANIAKDHLQYLVLPNQLNPSCYDLKWWFRVRSH